MLGALALSLACGLCALAEPAPYGPGWPDADRDRDGASDVDEIELGLDPDTPNIPEPLLFDMVRGLGARRGELELNTLVQTNPGSEAVSGGPEIEYAFAKGHAFELELPIATHGVQAWKTSLQGTLPAHESAWFTHGWLATGEYLLDDPGARGTAVYIAGARFGGRWSALAMIGGRAWEQQRGGAGGAVVFNPSVFYDASAYVTVGLETNALLDDEGTTDLVLLPQVHWQPSRSLKVQLGVGSHLEDDRATLLSALRVSYNY